MEARNEKSATQQQRVAAWLKTVGKITSLEALQLFGAFRLASIIHRLRKEGYLIESIPTERKGYRYVIYEYKGQASW